jgi:small subunit ribosomal protein S24e
MELEITDKRENTLLDRTEVKFTVSHPNQPTPRRENVREELSKELKVPKDRIVVDYMNSRFGLTISSGYAKIYKKKEVALEVERKHHLVRNKLIKDEKKKEAKPKEGEAPAEAPTEDAKAPENDGKAPAEGKGEKPAKEEKPEKEEKEPAKEEKTEKSAKKENEQPKKKADDKKEE